jgi:hypothetical protein
MLRFKHNRVVKHLVEVSGIGARSAYVEGPKVGRLHAVTTPIDHTILVVQTHDTDAFGMTRTVALLCIRLNHTKRT